jgi:hypothetical protein
MAQLRMDARQPASRHGKNVLPADTGGTRLSFQLLATPSPEQRLQHVFTAFVDRAASQGWRSFHTQLRNSNSLRSIAAAACRADGACANGENRLLLALCRSGGV